MELADSLLGYYMWSLGALEVIGGRMLIGMKKLAALLLTAGLSVAGCLTTATGPSSGEDEAETALPPSDARPVVTLTQPTRALFDVVNIVSKEVGGSLVLMDGIETLTTGPLELSEAPFETFVERLAADTACAFHVYPNYCFVFPPNYRGLLDVSVAGILDPSIEELTAAMTFSFQTPLFEVLALLSHTLGITLVADNIVADAQCGAMTLVEIPLQDCLDAALKSARVAQDAFLVDSTPEYTFLYAVGNTSPRVTLLEPEKLDASQNALLDSEVTVVLGATPGAEVAMQIDPGATSLGDVLASLSQQLGVEVTAEEGLAELPVNPCVFNRVRLRTAMDLLIRQWPVDEFGYQLDQSRVVIRSRESEVVSPKS